MVVGFDGATFVFGRKLCAGAVLSLLAVTLTAAAQLPSAITRPAPLAPATQEQPSDPLGRTTPRGTIRGFVKAADRNDFVTAAQYLQATGRQKETLARDLKELMNRYFSEPMALISDSPQGAADDGLPLDRERVGPLKINDNKIDILLVRVADPQSGRIWLISSDTLANVPELFDEIEENWLDRFMPEVLLNHALF